MISIPKDGIMKGVETIQKFPSRNEVDRLRKAYPIGTRIRLIHMEDDQAIEPGMTGTVEFVDDGGSVHMRWSNGRGLALIPGEDVFEVLSRPEEKHDLEEGMKML